MKSLFVYLAVYSHSPLQDANHAQQLWDDGKDFKIMNGPYTSCRDVAALRDLGYTQVVILLGPSGTRQHTIALEA